MELYFGLKVLWWLLLGVLLAGLAIMVGMDMGIGALLRFVGKTDTERRICLNTVGPHWDGNQVWFILGGGAIFAAFPLLYATAFSGLYIVMLLLLWTMIMRPLGFEYRSKFESPAWRNIFDWVLLVSGAVPMIVYGAGVGNMFLGVPFHFEWNLRSYYTGSFLALLNPFAVLCGLLSLALAVYMGGVMLMGRAGGAIADRARAAASGAAVLAIALFSIGGVWVSTMHGYVLLHSPDPGVAQNPLQQTVSVGSAGAWFANFRAHPALWLVPALGYLGLAAGLAMVRTRRTTVAWWLGALAWIGVLGTAGVALFPFLMPSSSNPSNSLTVWNCVSSQTDLLWSTGFAVVFVPLILWYTSWAFWVMRGVVDPAEVEGNDHAY